jgi:hypothetical protein
LVLLAKSSLKQFRGRFLLYENSRLLLTHVAAENHALNHGRERLPEETRTQTAECRSSVFDIQSVLIFTSGPQSSDAFACFEPQRLT